MNRYEFAAPCGAGGVCQRRVVRLQEGRRRYRTLPTHLRAKKAEDHRWRPDATFGPSDPALKLGMLFDDGHLLLHLRHAHG